MTAVPLDAHRPVILVVDDEPGNRELLSFLLSLEGFEVLAAVDGKDALEKIANNPCDLIITDYMMPRMDGQELVRRVRAQPSYGRVPIILTSAGFPPESDVMEEIEEFVSKPFVLEDLVRVINTLLKRT